VIDEVDVPRRRTRAEQRAQTRAAILDAAAQVLVDDGYTALTTRRVADVASVAQSTLMHHFPSREALLVDTVAHLAMQVADTVLDDLSDAKIRTAKERSALMDRMWEAFTSPQALAAAQLWYVAGAEPELAAALRDLEERLNAMLMAMASTIAPDLVDHPDFAALTETALALIRGLVMAIPVWGRDAVEERWRLIRPVLDRAGAELLDGLTV
jgi:AcrR family transcriptional regulator